MGKLSSKGRGAFALLAQAFLLSQLSVNLGDGQVHSGKDNARLKGLVIADEGLVAPPDGGADQDGEGILFEDVMRV